MYFLKRLVKIRGSKKVFHPTFSPKVCKCLFPSYKVDQSYYYWEKEISIFKKRKQGNLEQETDKEDLVNTVITSYS